MGEPTERAFLASLCPTCGLQGDHYYVDDRGVTCHRQPTNRGDSTRRNTLRRRAAWAVAQVHATEWDVEFIRLCEIEGLQPFPLGGRPREHSTLETIYNRAHPSGEGS